MTDRQSEIAGFVRRVGADVRTLRLIAGDASNRTYYRLKQGNHSVVLMDAPLTSNGPLAPFINIAKFLNSIGLSAPQILESDETLGFLLLEDLGSDLFARLMDEKPELETPLYQAAVENLLHVQEAVPPDLSRLDSRLMASQSKLAIEWYCGEKNDGLSVEFENRICEVLKPLDDLCTVFVHRDFHAENLLWLPKRTGVQRVGILDFQDAMVGHPSYDIVSILQDARRDVPRAIEREIFSSFSVEKTEEKEDLEFAYHALGLQRNLRILGIFARLSMRDGKHHYVDFIPRVWGHVEHNLRQIDMADLRDFIISEFPAPTDEKLAQLRARPT